jgi:hypothetical protein
VVGLFPYLVCSLHQLVRENAEAQQEEWFPFLEYLLHQLVRENVVRLE